MPHVEQELPTLPEHLNAPSIFSGVCTARSLIFYVMFCRLLFVLFLYAIVLSVLLQFTASDYSFVVFKIFFPWSMFTKVHLKDDLSWKTNIMVFEGKFNCTMFYVNCLLSLFSEMGSGCITRSWQIILKHVKTNGTAIEKRLLWLKILN